MTTVHADLNGTRIDRDAQEPIYRQIIRIIREQITVGIWSPGDRLPPTRDLADALGISRISVVNAYAELRETGLLSAHTGRGTFVAGSRDAAEPAAQQVRQLHTNAISHILNGNRAGPGVISFSGGTPAEEFFPVAAMRQALNAVLDRDGSAALAYEEMEGYAPLRTAIVDYLSPLGIMTRPEHVLVTSGSQQAIDLALQALCGENDTFLTTNPTYLGILDSARVRRVRAVGVPMDGEGLRVDLVEQAIHDVRPKLIYVTPTHHNPTGTVMPLHRRRQLLELAAHYRIPILEDGVYSELYYDGAPPPPIKALDTYGIVLYTSSFSKILLPGNRIGFILASGFIGERLLRIKSAADLCTSTLNQRALHYYLHSGALSGHLDRVRHACRDRRTAAVRALTEYMPRGTCWTPPSGGVYIWVQLPLDGPSAAELYATAVGHGATFVMGNLFHTDLQNNGGSHLLRLNFGAHPPDRIHEGIRRIGAAWRAIRSNQTPLGGKPII